MNFCIYCTIRYGVQNLDTFVHILVIFVQKRDKIVRILDTVFQILDNLFCKKSVIYLHKCIFLCTFAANYSYGKYT